MALVSKKYLGISPPLVSLGTNVCGQTARYTRQRRPDFFERRDRLGILCHLCLELGVILPVDHVVDRRLGLFPDANLDRLADQRPELRQHERFRVQAFFDTDRGHHLPPYPQFTPVSPRTRTRWSAAGR